MPQSYQAHNTLGQFLEKKGKYADALAEYRQSLKLEWNQPPTIEAKTRMEKLLNQK
jgi:Flp pilus assembly protein TadD